MDCIVTVGDFLLIYKTGIYTVGERQLVVARHL